MGRIFIIGDIHGCLDEFRELVEKLKLADGDRVVCLGDFFDKGPDPVGCMRFARRQGFESVLGNHEERHLRWRRHEDKKRTDPGYINPMKPLSTEHQWHNAELSDVDVAWLNSLPIVIRLPHNFVAVHGGLIAGKTLDEQLASKKDTSKMMRLRWVNETGKHVPVDYDTLTQKPEGTFHWTELYDGDHNVVYGHEAHSLSGVRMDHIPRQGGWDVDCYGIDTGCVHGGHLTALVLGPPRPNDGVRPPGDGGPSVSTIQVKAKKVYEDPLWFIPG